MTIPPAELTARLKSAPARWQEAAGYLERGRTSRNAIERRLPAGWRWACKRVLDFGCGAGRTIRHFSELAGQCELWGCDIDKACIEWDRANLDPWISFVVNEEEPPLPFADRSFHLVYALSVFTHLTDHWASWLIEVDRILVPGGLLVATVMSEAMCQAVSGEPWDENRVGMNVYEAGQSWDQGGPMVLHSPWWIRGHWGRLFDVEHLQARGFLAEDERGGQDDHGVVVLVKSGRAVTVDELERPDPGDPREATALQHDVVHLRTKLAEWRARLPPGGD